MNKYNLQNCNFPSLANSKLGAILEMKRIEEILKPSKEKLNLTPKLFTKTLTKKLKSLKNYSRRLNSNILNNKELNKKRIYSLILNSRKNINSNGIVSNTNKGISNSINTKELVKSNLGLEIPLPLELYAGQASGQAINYDLVQSSNRILDLNFNRIIRHMNIFSKFDSELATYQNVVYKFKNVQNHSTLNIYSILESTFYPMFSLIGKPYFYHGSNKVELRLDFFRGKSKNKQGGNLGVLDFNSPDMKPLLLEKFSLLGDVLVQMFNKPVELELNRLHVPFTNSTILSKVIGRFSKVRKYKTILEKLLRFAKFKSPRSLNRYKENNTISNIASKSMIPSFMCGLKVTVGGRLLTQSVIPRKTVSIYQRGCLARGKANFVNTARFTNKNKRGAYSITVSIANVFA